MPGRGQVVGVERLVDHRESGRDAHARIIAVLMLRGPDHIAMRTGDGGTATTVVKRAVRRRYGGPRVEPRTPEADLPTYRVTFRPLPGVRRLLLDVEADDLEAQRGGALLAWSLHGAGARPAARRWCCRCPRATRGSSACARRSTVDEAVD